METNKEKEKENPYPKIFFIPPCYFFYFTMSIALCLPHLYALVTLTQAGIKQLVLYLLATTKEMF